MSRKSRFLIALLIVCLLLVAHIVYMSFVCDDAFISFRYARNLAEGHGLVFNLGEHVEGYTNFLWTLLMSLVFALGARPEVVSIWISGTFMVGATLLLLWLGYHRQRDYLFTGLLIAANGGIATWATGGLETAMFTLFVTAAFVFTVPAIADDPDVSRTRFLTGSSVALILATLTRPEGIFVAGLFGLVLIGLTFSHVLSWRAFFRWLVPIVAVFVLYIAWRWWYYGDFVPHTYYVKAADFRLLSFGAQYFLDAFRRWYIYLALLPLMILIVTGQRLGIERRTGILATAVVLPYVAYVILVGGDFMDMFRFLVPVLPIGLFVCGQTWRRLYQWLSERAKPILATAVIILLVIANSALNVESSHDSQDVWYRDGLDSVGLMRKYHDDWTVYARALATVSQPTDTVAINAAGIIPYYTNCYTLDMLGLVAPSLYGFIRRNPARPGHILAASGWLLLQRNPQFIIAHPAIIDNVDDAQTRLPVTDEEFELLAQRYDKIGLVVSTNPKRYAVLAVRRDIVKQRNL